MWLCNIVNLDIIIYENHIHYIICISAILWKNDRCLYGNAMAVVNALQYKMAKWRLTFIIIPTIASLV